MLLANVVALLHAAAILFMVTGSLLAVRRPRLLWLHVPVSLVILVLYATGSDCPLTTWELALRTGAGEPGYTGGFIGHYITEPLGFPVEATSTQIGIYVVAFLPNLIGYGLIMRRSFRRSASQAEVSGPGRRVRRPPQPVPASPRSRPPTAARTRPGRRR